MSKQDAAWLAIRVLGLYWSVHAVTELPGVVLLVSTILSAGSNGGGAELAQHLSGATGSAITLVLQFLLNAVIGVHLLFKGQVAFGLLCRIGRAHDSAA